MASSVDALWYSLQYSLEMDASGPGWPPASQAVSKQHCAFHVREGKVFVVDFGSTNGTSVNDEQLPANLEREVKHGDRIKAGPLDFTLSLAQTKSSDSTPLPADLKAMHSPEASKLKEAATGSKPAIPKPAAKSSSVPPIRWTE